MRSSSITLCCVLAVLQPGPSCSSEVYQPHYHQSVPYRGEIIQNIERGEGLQETAYDPTVSQITLDGISPEVTSRRIECNPVYTQEAPYVGVFNQNISSEASGIQRLAYQPTFLQEEHLKNIALSSATVTQNAPHDTSFKQEVGDGSTGDQNTLIAPGFHQSSLSTRLHGCSGGFDRQDSPEMTAYTQNVPIGTNQSQSVGGNGTGFQSLDVRPSFSQSAGNIDRNQNSSTTFVQENCFEGSMSQVINEGGRGVQRSGYAPTFAQNEFKVESSRKNDNCLEDEDHEDKKAGGMSGGLQQSGVYNNEMRQVIYPGGSGLQSSHFAPVFTQHHTVVRKKTKKGLAERPKNTCSMQNTCCKANSCCEPRNPCKFNSCCESNVFCRPSICCAVNTY